MFLHNFKYAFKILFRNKTLIFWTFAFPIILGTLFNLAFSNISNSEKLDLINIAVIDNEEFNNNVLFKDSIKTLSDKNNSDRIFKTKFKGALNGTNGNLNVDGETSLARSVKMSDTVVAQVVQVLPNGNLLVQGKKSLVNQNERIDLILSGIVDPKWINQSGQINSSKVANLQFAMNGAGTVSRGQNEGILDKTIRTIF